jgi:hypothetical protein
MSELRECPCCGSNDIYVSHEDVYCQECTLQTGVYESDDEAMQAWNNRASDKRIEQLEKENKELQTALILLQSECVNRDESGIIDSDAFMNSRSLLNAKDTRQTC